MRLTRQQYRNLLANWAKIFRNHGIPALTVPEDQMANALDRAQQTYGTLRFMSIDIIDQPRTDVEPPEDLGLTIEKLDRIVIECLDALDTSDHFTEFYNSIRGMVCEALKAANIAYPEDFRRRQVNWKERREALGYLI